MLPLDAFLLKPVQRVLKYSLLLYEMGKRTQTDSDSYEVVQVRTFVQVHITCSLWYIDSGYCLLILECSTEDD